MRPAVRRLKKSYAGRIDILNVSTGNMRNSKLNDQVGVAYTPTFVFVRSDGKIQSMMVGDVDEERLVQELDLLATAP
jgi:hypothetical protein